MRRSSPELPFARALQILGIDVAQILAEPLVAGVLRRNLVAEPFQFRHLSKNPEIGCW